MKVASATLRAIAGARVPFQGPTRPAAPAGSSSGGVGGVVSRSPSRMLSSRRGSTGYLRRRMHLWPLGGVTTVHRDSNVVEVSEHGPSR